MKRYLYISIVCFLIGIISAMFIGCTAIIQPTCVSRSLFTSVGTALGVGYPVRIVISHTAVNDVDHAQAQAFVNGRWTWLTQYGDKVELSDINEERLVATAYRPFIEYKYLTVSELIDELKKGGKIK